MLLVNTEIVRAYWFSITESLIWCSSVWYIAGNIGQDLHFSAAVVSQVKHLLLKHIDKMPVGYYASLAFGNWFVNWYVKWKACLMTLFQSRGDRHYPVSMVNFSDGKRKQNGLSHFSTAWQWQCQQRGLDACCGNRQQLLTWCSCCFCSCLPSQSPPTTQASALELFAKVW